MQFDHVAISSGDIARSVAWYREQFGAEVIYEDATWAFLAVAGLKLALVNPQQHPPHVAMAVSDAELAAAAKRAGLSIATHRDNTRGIYLHDPFGNVVELIHYPEKP